MRIVQTVHLTLHQTQSMFELWNSQYPERITYDEILEFRFYLEELSNKKHYLLFDHLNQLYGWAFTFVREEENWFGIIIDSKIQGKGFGTILLEELKKNNSFLNGWVIDHQNDIKRNKELYLPPLEFYKKNGFIVDQNTRIENDKISAVKIRWTRT